jgi:hypothetical protein
MLKRRPPFALVLSALVAAAALVIVLTGRGGSRQAPTTGQTPTVGIGPAHACMGTRTAAAITARSAIIVTASATAPLTVTEQATGPNGTAAVTRSEAVSARVRADQPVAVRHVSVVAGRACAAGQSVTAARTAALRAAYAAALARARADAAAGAGQALRSEMNRLYPSVLETARAQASARAHALSLAAEPALAAKALAEARRHAGG